jgi:site-specific recombinase XerD
MTKRNAENERVKRRYLIYLKDAKGRDNASIDAAASAIERFEEYIKRREFRSFHIEQARSFKAHLSAATNARTGEPLSASTVHATLAALKAFFVWLADQPATPPGSNMRMRSTSTPLTICRGSRPRAGSRAARRLRRFGP